MEGNSLAAPPPLLLLLLSGNTQANQGQCKQAEEHRCNTKSACGLTMKPIGSDDCIQGCFKQTIAIFGRPQLGADLWCFLHS